MAKRIDHQHVVPRAYLRGWADSDKHILVLDRGSRKPKRLPVSHTAVRKKFYNCVGADDAETDAVEKWLAADIESPAGRSLSELREGADLSGVDRQAVVRFTIAQLIRTPTVFATMDSIDSQLGPLLLLCEVARVYGVELLHLSDADRTQCFAAARQAWAMQQSDYDTRASRLRTMVRLHDEIVIQVAAWHWSVLTSPEPLLPTGDSPVVAFTPNPWWSGLLPQGSPLWMPISPTKLLIGEPHEPLRQQTELTTELATIVANALARQADRSLFYQPGLTWPSGLVLSAQKPTLPKPTVSLSESTGPPTFPAANPPVASSAVESLLKELGGIGSVD